MNIFTSTKRFTGFPCTHRQWKAESHCRFVHGYSREFYFEFACHSRTPEGWVVDFGGLKQIKSWLEHWFDHTFLVSQDDPFLSTFESLDAEGVIQLRVMPNPSMEGTCEFLYEHLNPIVKKITQDRAWITKIEVRENAHNSAIYTPTENRL